MKSDYPGDFLFFCAIAGGIAAPLKLLVLHAFVWAKLAKPFYMNVTAYLTHGHMQTTGFIEGAFAELGDIAFGAAFGIILGLWLKHSRFQYHWWIGLGYGLGIWFASLAFGNLTKIIKPDMTDNWSLFALLLAMLTFGLLFVLATRLWGPLKNRLAIECDTGWKRKQ
jgi:hypothetical protein